MDDKIENNENIIAQINKLATLFYKEECNKESKVVSLGDYIKNYDKERKPLSSRERNSLKKLYPYYGATEVVDFVDNYLFDGDYVLLGEDGTVIESKNKIPEVINDKTCKISRIFITPSNCKPAPGVIEAIMEADAIVIGPGSLYTNVIPNLLVKGVAKAIKESKAFKVYVSNLMTEPGQTDNYSLSEHIKAINEHVGKGVIEYCLYDTGEIIPEYIRKYNLEGSELVEQDVSKVKVDGVYMIQRHLSHIANGYIRHNPDAIAAAIIQLICDDLKFNNMENNAQYMMLNNKLKDSKKSLKKQTKENKNKIKDNKAKHADKRGKSKFFEKYSDRIESIQESDLKQKEKMKKNSKK